MENRVVRLSICLFVLGWLGVEYGRAATYSSFFYHMSELMRSIGIGGSIIAFSLAAKEWMNGCD